MRYKIRAEEIFTETGIINNGYITVEDNMIQHIRECNSIEKEVVSNKYKLIPGLIDMHIHGANGYDTMDASYTSLNEISKYLCKNGVAAFLPTIVTSPLGKIANAVINVHESMIRGVEGAAILGSYIEGPYISEKHKGAHPSEYIRDISLEELKKLIQVSCDTVRIVAIAPEKKGALEAIKLLKDHNIKVSIGHTDALSEDINMAVDAGANIGVHIFNGMRGIHHREPGAAGALMLNDKVYTELIADGIHVHPDMVKALVRCKGVDKVCLITDCIMAGGLPDGDYMLGELKVAVKNSICRIENGALAGSTLKLIDGVKNLIRFANTNPLNAVHSASLVPASILGLSDRLGSIKPGKLANITAVDDDFNVVMTMVEGKVVYISNDFKLQTLL